MPQSYGATAAAAASLSGVAAPLCPANSARRKSSRNPRLDQLLKPLPSSGRRFASSRKSWVSGLSHLGLVVTRAEQGSPASTHRCVHVHGARLSSRAASATPTAEGVILFRLRHARARSTHTTRTSTSASRASPKSAPSSTPQTTRRFGGWLCSAAGPFFLPGFSTGLVVTRASLS